MHSSTVVLESQPDWLTAVFVGQKTTAAVSARVQALMRSERVGGNRELPFRCNEYTGTRCGRVRAGQTAAHLLVQLSGDLAALYLDWFRARATYITRLDLAVTVQTTGYAPDIARDSYFAASAYRTEHPRSAVPSLVLNGAGGSTCYIGKRTSDRYFRAYDKQFECKASGDQAGAERYLWAWRFELELHDDEAAIVAHTLPPLPHRPAWISAYIHTYLVNHGVTPIWNPQMPPIHVSGFRRRTDRESRLDWLSRSVAPTVRWLIDSTPRDELMNRLGLSDTSGGDNGNAHD